MRGAKPCGMSTIGRWFEVFDPDPWQRDVRAEKDSNNHALCNCLSVRGGAGAGRYRPGFF